MLKSPLLNLIEFTNKCLYCPAGGFYIDPWRAVDRALITHAHGDHARWGCKHYLSHHDSLPILKVRLGTQNPMQGIDYGEEININGVKVSFHPAGHIIGSAQIRLEYKGEVWVVSGDYKLEEDGVCTPFESVKCNVFVTESTFGLPIYRWQPQVEIMGQINSWWQQNAERGFASIIFAYSLGKAQRLLSNLDQSLGPIYLHGAIFNIQNAYHEYGIPLPQFPRVEPSMKKDVFRNAMIIAPPSAAGSGWMKRFAPCSMGVASGWMALRGMKRRRAADKGFVLSDHADWDGLNSAIKATGAEKVYVTHGYTTPFSAWLREQGLQSEVVETLYEGEMAEAADEITTSEGEET
ncbi:MAG: ligase-associated DNA damage response exonuclease [Bacteroidota bacterium]|nr:ligase-associated DNA damage response exonuclease [Bacteroidota bacterium]